MKDLNKRRIKLLVAEKARQYKLTHKAVDPLVFAIEQVWNVHGHFDWFKVSEQRARLITMQEPAVTTIVLAVSIDAIKKNVDYYFQPMTEQEIRDEAQLGNTDQAEQVPAEVLSTTDIGRHRE